MSTENDPFPYNDGLEGAARLGPKKNDGAADGHWNFNSSVYQPQADITNFANVESDVTDLDGNVISTVTEYNKIVNYMPTYLDASDAYANFKGAIMTFKHVSSGQVTAFKAFITSFNETYKCDWSAEHVYGRIDPIYSFKSTGRSVTLNFNIPASTEGEAFKNLHDVGKLSDFLYPHYTSLGEAQTVAQSPLVRIKLMNLLESQKRFTSDAENFGDAYNGYSGYTPYGRRFHMLSRGNNDHSDNGVLAAISSLTINHNLEKPDAGVFEMGYNTVLPKVIEVSVSFDVIHDYPRGYHFKSSRQTAGGPYGLDPNTTAGRSPTITSTDPSRIDAANATALSDLQIEQIELEQERAFSNAQQLMDNAAAQSAGLSAWMGKRRADRLADRSNRIYARTDLRSNNTMDRLDSLDQRIEEASNASSTTDWNTL